MASQLKEADQKEHKLARRVGRSIRRLVTRVSGSRIHQMNGAGTQLVFDQDEKNQQLGQQPGDEHEPEVLIGMQPLSRRRVKVRIVNRKRLEPRFAYDPTDEELAAVG